MESTDLHLFETEEIKLCNMTKVLTDEVFTKHSLFYSREIPTKSMEIHDIPLNQEKALDELFWLRYTLLKIGDDTLRIVISSSYWRIPN